MAHGRIETRVGVVIEAKGLAEHHDFPGLKAFGRITATRTIDQDHDRRAHLRAVEEAPTRGEWPDPVKRENERVTLRLLRRSGEQSATSP